MMKSEFEALAIRGSESISPVLYNTIERFYTSESDYHAANGGIYETKQEFVIPRPQADIEPETDKIHPQKEVLL